MIFIDFDLYLFTIPGSLKLHPDLHRRYFERVVDLILKNWAPTDLANISHQKKILNLVLKKI